MGIEVVWQDENGNELSRCGVAYDVRLNGTIPPDRSHCLQYIDPAGDATFNQDQLRRLVQELEEAAAARLEGSRLRDNALAVLEFVRGCVGTHTYVKFVGD